MILANAVLPDRAVQCKNVAGGRPAFCTEITRSATTELLLAVRKTHCSLMGPAVIVQT